MKTKIYSILSLVIWLLSACESPIENNQTLNFDTRAILTNIAENIILPQLSTFQTTTDSLVAATQKFEDSASTQNLTKLRAAWLAAMLEWESVTPFAFGPAYDLNSDFNLNYWATSTSLIEAEMEGTSALNAIYFANLGVSKKGFPAMEYLIYKYKNLDSTTQTFQSIANAKRRKSYLKNLALDIQAQSRSLSNAWKNGYKDSFIKNDGNNASSSLTALVNQMIAALEVVINKNRQSAW
jgi:predicted lipoprotein